MATRKAKDTAAQYADKLALARVVVGQAQVLAARLERERDPKRRAALERRLAAAYVALRPTWTMSTVATGVLKVIDQARRMIAHSWVEDRATQWAVNGIAGVMDDLYAPDELAGRAPPPELVKACLRAQPPRPGRPRNGSVSSDRAARDLLGALGVSGAGSANAVAQRRSRQQRRRKP